MVTSFVGVFAFAAAASGWLLKRCSTLDRVLLAAAGLSLVHPADWTDAAGIVLLALTVVMQMYAGKPQSAGKRESVDDQQAG